MPTLVLAGGQDQVVPPEVTRQVAERIQVFATAPVLATDTSDVGQVIANRQIVDLPLNGRTYIQLAALTNGVLLTGGTESGGANILSEGGRIHQNSFLVDGVETRIQREGGYGVFLEPYAGSPRLRRLRERLTWLVPLDRESPDERPLVSEDLARLAPLHNPPAVAGILMIISPKHMRLLFADPLGLYMVAAAIFLQVVGVLIIRRIVDVEY